MHPESMPGNKKAAERRDAASSRRRAQDAHPERHVDERDRLAGERDVLANKRDVKADERDSLANERDRQADERDRQADERERGADERQILANERQRKADERDVRADERDRKADERDALANERERGLDERFRKLRREVELQEQRALELIEWSRELRAVRRERLPPQQARVQQRQEREVRQQAQADADRASAVTKPTPTRRPSGASQLAERALKMRSQAVRALEAFVVTEEEVARVHEDLAAKHPERHDEFLHRAEEARRSAQRAHEVLRNFGESAPIQPRA